MPSAEEGPGHPGKVSECGCIAQDTVRTQHMGAGMLLFPAQAFGITQHVLGKVAAVTAVPEVPEVTAVTAVTVVPAVSEVPAVSAVAANGQ